MFRVGGRLNNSTLSFENKHPALLPRNSRLTELIIMNTHNRYLHPGINTTLYLIQQNFWLISGRKLVRRCLQKCLRCLKVSPTNITPCMADLPASRVSIVEPFSVVGVSYFGYRGARTQKGLIFVSSFVLPLRLCT